MGWLQGVMLSYGLFSIVMGFLGYLHAAKPSIISLIAGGVAGLLVIAFAALTKTNPRVGFIGASVVGLLLAIKFGPNAIGGQVYPAGIIFVVSLLFVATLVGAHFAATSKRKKPVSIDPST